MSQASSPAMSDTSTTSVDSKKPKRRKQSKNKQDRCELFLRHGNKYKDMLAVEVAILEKEEALRNQRNPSILISRQATTPIIGTPSTGANLHENVILAPLSRQHYLDVQSPLLTSITSTSSSLDNFSRPTIPTIHLQQHSASGILERSRDESSILTSLLTASQTDPYSNYPAAGQQQVAPTNGFSNQSYLPSPSFVSNSTGGLNENHWNADCPFQHPRHFETNGTYGSVNLISKF